MWKVSPRNAIFTLLGVLVLSLGLTGCGNDTPTLSSTPAPEPMPSSTPASQPTPSSTPVLEPELTSTQNPTPTPDIQQFLSNDSVGCH